ncbi:hypothetical protein LTR53_013126 [Teratosphaeriaceae sp. CCFEE 6253]|nr:hypothetical protein LTR53_013126 [Teratosphaeriaceae sp. CCFEE 6253]
MNNNQFRKLLSDTPSRQNDGSSSSATPAFSAKRSSIVPMTPRAVKGGIDVDFARQVRERNAAVNPMKKFRSAAAPKGAKLAKGYTDRARAREEKGDGEDDRAARIKALEEQMKLGQISMEMFEGLRDQITGGEASSTHLVKGLDRQLLERVKRGEDVLGVGGGEKTAVAEPVPDVDEELDKLGEQEVVTVQREKAKKGSMASPSLAGKKRNRDEIMAEMKAQREAAARAKAAPQLDARWRKVGEKEKSRVEIDSKGREVIITVDEDGVVKKKVRKVPSQDPEIALDMPDASRAILGADSIVPEAISQPTPLVEDDEDIFDGVGTAYNPLGDEPDDVDDSGEESDVNDDVLPLQQSLKPPDEPSAPKTERTESDDQSDESEPHELPAEPPEVSDEPAPKPESVRRSYFAAPSATVDESSIDHFAGIQNVIKKAAQLGQSKEPSDEDDDAREGETAEAHQTRLKRRTQMLARQDRDLDDMDMGFGGSRVEDEADGDEEGGAKIKLSEWKEGGKGGDGGDEEGGKGGREKKKRKPKKRKGDANSAADIMRVMEGRKGKHLTAPRPWIQATWESPTPATSSNAGPMSTGVGRGG